MKNGKQGTILLGKGNNITTIDKNKEGKLAVVSFPLVSAGEVRSEVIFLPSISGFIWFLEKGSLIGIGRSGFLKCLK